MAYLFRNGLLAALIENLWHEMRKMLRKRPAGAVPELKDSRHEIRDSFTLEFCQGFVKTTPHQVSAVINK